MRLLIRWAINAAALWIAAYFLPDVSISGSILDLFIVAAIFGLVNAFIKPILKLLTLPINLLTLGLFTLVINALMLLLTGWVSDALVINGFFPALFAGVIISIVSTILSWILPD